MHGKVAGLSQRYSSYSINQMAHLSGESETVFHCKIVLISCSPRRPRKAGTGLGIVEEADPPKKTVVLFRFFQSVFRADQGMLWRLRSKCLEDLNV